MDKKLYNKEYWIKNRVRLKEKKDLYNKEYRLKNKKPINKKYYINNKERLRNLRLDVLKHYGGDMPSCKCCGENGLVFLAIDHINGDGNKHRKEIFKDGKGNIISWIIKNNYPDLFQILCHNCNNAKSILGSCPHDSIDKNISI